MAEKFKTTDAVFAAIIKDHKVLLLQRQNTGWLDGFWDTPSGHLEENETVQAAARRELQEETGLRVDEDELRLFHVCQNYHSEGRPYIFFIFEAMQWSGEPTIQEPDKCADMRFFELDQLPKVTPYVKLALGNLPDPGVTFSYFGPGSIKE